MDCRILHFLGSRCSTRNTSIRFYRISLLKISTNSVKWLIEPSLSSSQPSLRILSRHGNKWSFESSGPIILPISCRLQARGMRMSLSKNFIIRLNSGNTCFHLSPPIACSTAGKVYATLRTISLEPTCWLRSESNNLIYCSKSLSSTAEPLGS